MVPSTKQIRHYLFFQEKNVSTDILDGKVGRIYVPKQEVGTMALAKMKGGKRERRERKVGEKAEQKKQRAE